MKTVKGQPITGAKRHFSKKRPFVPDAKDTSADAQTMIQEPPAPFKNRLTTAQMPADSAAPGGISTMEPRIQSGFYGGAAPSLPPGAPVGQRKPINQSGQVYGRMGTSHPARKRHPAPEFKSKRNASFYGE